MHQFYKKKHETWNLESARKNYKSRKFKSYKKCRRCEFCHVDWKVGEWCRVKSKTIVFPKFTAIVCKYYTEE